MAVKFDHIEAHVNEIGPYCRFLTTLFEGGTTKLLSDNGTSMYTSPDGYNIEVKKKQIETTPSMSGFCNPCIRRQEPLEFITGLGLKIDTELSAPAESIFFFRDHEGVLWHIKELQA